jgi:outer membrane murein-binding lipoprotein Lpp
MMRGSLLLTVAAVAVLALAGCNKAEPPDKVASDVAKATAAAEKKDDRAEQQAEKTDAAVTNDLSKDVDKANDKEVRTAADDAVTQAQGENKIALAKCEALAGDAQKQCKDQANAELDMVKQRAKALKSGG